MFLCCDKQATSAQNELHCCRWTMSIWSVASRVLQYLQWNSISMTTWSDCFRISWP